jgi:hypothetical protein
MAQSCLFVEIDCENSPVSYHGFVHSLRVKPRHHVPMLSFRHLSHLSFAPLVSIYLSERGGIHACRGLLVLGFCKGLSIFLRNNQLGL